VVIQLSPLRCAGLIGVAFVLVAAAGSSQYDPKALQTQLTGARAQVVANFPRIASESGYADELVARLDEDQTALRLTDASDPAATEQMSLRVGLDVSLARQLVGLPSATVPAIARGAQIRLVRSSVDRTFQPVAVYVPSQASLDRPNVLVIVLHGHGQTESDFLSEPSLRKLADESDAIVAVPRLRGDRPVDATTTSDLYDTATSLLADFKIDPRRVYLAGFSEGGFQVFMLAPHDPNRWAGVLSAGGTLTNDDKDVFARAMQGKPTFLVIGSDDPLVKAEYVRGAAGYLNANGVDSHYYEQRGGVHSLDSLMPTLQRAWNDMLAGVHFGTPEPDAVSPLPTPSQRY